MKRTIIAALVIASMSGPAHAITTAQRVAILKYQHCLQWQVLMPWITCHL